MKNLKNIMVYQEWKTITDKMYEGILTPQNAAIQLIKLLNKYDTKLRSQEHKLTAFSFFVYDKDQYSDPVKEKPLGLGLIYKKPDDTKTQDIFIITPVGKLDKFYSEEEMVKKYPAMKGTHKKLA